MAKYSYKIVQKYLGISEIIANFAKFFRANVLLHAANLLDDSVVMRKLC